MAAPETEVEGPIPGNEQVPAAHWRRGGSTASGQDPWVHTVRAQGQKMPPDPPFQGMKKVKISDGSGMEKFGFGRVQVYPNSWTLGSGMSGIEKSRVQAGMRKVSFGRVQEIEFGQTCVDYFQNVINYNY